MVYNPSLRQEPRSKKAAVIPPNKDTSILDWLEKSGRLLSRDSSDIDYPDDEEEIADLMGGDDNSFEMDDDDELDLEE
jgi:hypothetical protein